LSSLTVGKNSQRILVMKIKVLM